jgi:uncharacterized protein
MRQEILSQLEEIEKQKNVIIFYACESGSRAWGFSSKDSDYDVRFLYIHPQDWYLSIDAEDKRDVIECPIVNDLDINGWDLRKALKLLRKSNPPLLEWLNSPIIYKEKFAIAHKIREIIPQYYSKVACSHHYLHMAQGTFREYLKGDIVRAKKYFYVLRPLLAINWLENESDLVPLEFSVLVKRCVKSPDLEEAIADLLERKQQGHELDREPKIKVISDFVESELERIEIKITNQNMPKPDIEGLNNLFRKALVEVCQN